MSCFDSWRAGCNKVKSLSVTYDHLEDALVHSRFPRRHCVQDGAPQHRLLLLVSENLECHEQVFEVLVSPGRQVGQPGGCKCVLDIRELYRVPVLVLHLVAFTEFEEASSVSILVLDCCRNALFVQVVEAIAHSLPKAVQANVLVCVVEVVVDYRADACLALVGLCRLCVHLLTKNLGLELLARLVANKIKALVGIGAKSPQLTVPSSHPQKFPP